ncbi:hypothetical protein G7Y79_00011g031350 [Physcia stellaris]|nr:hypothetical protein G7Y79_00011g031350 [Physcia stellaris]
MDIIIDPNHPINTNLDLVEETREEAVSRCFVFVSKVTVDAGETECSICKVLYLGFTNTQPCLDETKEMPVRLACGHIFGQLCITEWLDKHSSCPTCRHEVLPFTPAQRYQIQYSLTRSMVESWQRSRARYLEKLEADLPSSSNALLFLQKYTTNDAAPNPHLEWITSVIVQRPELLQNDRYRAAKYFKGFAGRNLPIPHATPVNFSLLPSPHPTLVNFSHRTLVNFIRSDLRDDEILRDTGL